MYSTCYMTPAAYIGVLVVIGVICFFVAVASIWNMRGTRAMPRLICLTVLVSSLAEIGHVVALGIEGKPGIAAQVFMIILNTFGTCIAPFLLLWTLVSPTMELLRLHAKRDAVLWRIKIFIVVFFCEQIAVHGTAVFFLYQGDYKRFNAILASQFFFMMFYCAFWVVALRYYSSILFKQMDQLLNRVRDSKDMSPKAIGEDSSSSFPPNDKIARHRNKLGS